MEVNEQLEETGVEAEVAHQASSEEIAATTPLAPTPLSVSAPAPSPEAPAPSPEASVPSPQPPALWLRLAYSIEFLIALTAIFTVWSQVGGQGHLDLLPWYSKLTLTLALAWCCVRFTAGLVEHATWTRSTTAWFAGIVIVSIAMAGLTYYYHLHEVPDESDSDDTTATTVSLPRWRL